MAIRIETAGYNQRRYYKPWIGRVDFSKSTKGDFSWGDWTGDHYNGGEGVLTIDAKPGDIIATGQPAGVYTLRVGGSQMSCPQDWASKIHKEESDEKEAAIIIRNVPKSIRAQLKAKAALEGKSMQGLILELITKHVKG